MPPGWQAKVTLGKAWHIMTIGSSSRFLEESTPAMVRRVVAGSGMVFVPVSPLVEWHSLHLPLGTDGLIAEGVAQALAEAVDGLCLRCLPIGLDEIRSPEFKRRQGLPPEAEVMGMNYPGFPVVGEYHDAAVLEAMLAVRLEALRRSGFRLAFVVSQHGGKGQDETIAAVAAAESRDGFRAEPLPLAKFGKMPADDPESGDFRLGGHAGLAETIQVMAFRPDLVRPGELPAGELSAAALGILHSGPVIPGEANPRRAGAAAAARWRDNLLRNLLAHVRQVAAGHGPAAS